MKKVLIAIVATVVVGSSVFFYACKKDTETSQFTQVKNLKSTGNYQQPTQIVDINTVIRVGTVDYPVTGSAVVGSYDGQMYECNVTWEMPEPITDPAPIAPTYLTVTLTATLKPEYHDVMINVDLVMENYDITITPTMVTEEVDVADLWQNIVDICNAAVIDAKRAAGLAYYEEHLDNVQEISNSTGVDIIQLASMGIMNEFDDYFNEELFVFTGDTLAFIENLMPLANYMEQTCSYVSSISPSFNNLSSEMKTLVLSEIGNHARLKTKLDENGGDPICFGPLEDERDDRLFRAKLGIGISTVAAISSVFGGPIAAGLGLIGLVSASSDYCEKVQLTWEIYWLKGGTESRPKGLVCND